MTPSAIATIAHHTRNDICATTNNIRLSPRGIFEVYNYAPQEGESGTPLTATLKCLVPRSAVHNPLSFRLVIGNKAVRTAVSEVSMSGRFEVHADIPTIEMHGFISTIVGLVVQVIDGSGQIIDSAAFGHFTYWGSDVPPLSTPYIKDEHSNPLELYPHRRPEMLRTDSNSTACSTSDLSGTTAMSRTNSEVSQVSSSSGRPCRRRRLEKSASTCDDTPIPSLRRTFGPNAFPKSFNRNESPVPAANATEPTLEIMTPIDTLWLGWSQKEISLGRRLVKFTQIRSANKLLVSCEAIPQEEYEEGMVVISCIRRSGADTYHVSSVDILYLVENIVGETLTTDEKNRLRRNVECYKPLTVSKLNQDTKDFFQQLMDFPPPQPRNIEKDLKVFQWKFLKPALLKVLSKYSLGGSKIHPIVADPVDISALTLTISHSTDTDTPSSEDSRAISPITPDLPDQIHDNRNFQGDFDTCIGPLSGMVDREERCPSNCDPRETFGLLSSSDHFECDAQGMISFSPGKSSAFHLVV